MDLCLLGKMQIRVNLTSVFKCFLELVLSMRSPHPSGVCFWDQRSMCQRLKSCQMEFLSLQVIAIWPLAANDQSARFEWH